MCEPMPICFPNGKIIFFAHVPKTGGSSVEDYIIRRFGSMSMLDKHKNARMPGTGLISPITHLSALDLEEIIPTECDLCFAVVRDPLKRMFSQYRWQSGASRMSRMDFSTWLRVMVMAARIDPRIYFNHIRPQDQMVPAGAEIFRLEDGFGGMIERLDAVTGTTAPEVTMGHQKNRQKDATPIRASREDVALIADFYSADYERFGYDRPDLAALESDSAAWRRDLIAAPLARMLVAKQRRDWLR